MKNSKNIPTGVQQTLFNLQPPSPLPKPRTPLSSKWNKSSYDSLNLYQHLAFLSQLCLLSYFFFIYLQYFVVTLDNLRIFCVWNYFILPQLIVAFTFFYKIQYFSLNLFFCFILCQIYLVSNLQSQASFSIFGLRQKNKASHKLRKSQQYKKKRRKVSGQVCFFSSANV